jgi:hypothetical protein
LNLREREWVEPVVVTTALQRVTAATTSIRALLVTKQKMLQLILSKSKKVTRPKA